MEIYLFQLQYTYKIDSKLLRSEINAFATESQLVKFHLFLGSHSLS